MKDIVLGHKAERDEFLSAQYVQREGLQNARKNVKNNLIQMSFHIQGSRKRLSLKACTRWKTTLIISTRHS